MGCSAAAAVVALDPRRAFCGTKTSLVRAEIAKLAALLKPTDVGLEEAARIGAWRRSLLNTLEDFSLLNVSHIRLSFSLSFSPSVFLSLIHSLFIYFTLFNPGFFLASLFLSISSILLFSLSLSFFTLSIYTSIIYPLTMGSFKLVYLYLTSWKTLSVHCV